LSPLFEAYLITVPTTSPCAINLRAKRIQSLAAATVEELQPSSHFRLRLQAFGAAGRVEVALTVRLGVAGCT